MQEVATPGMGGDKCKLIDSSLWLSSYRSELDGTAYDLLCMFRTALYFLGADES